MIVGVTGGIGSGKTTVTKIFKEFPNVAVYEADIEAKKLMNSSVAMQTEISKKFGKKAYLNNQLNKAYIADIVFKNKEKLAVLNSIVHPEVAIHFQKFVANYQDTNYILYENAILFENKNNALCNYIITVSAPLETRIQRVIERDDTTRKAILNRIKNQWSEEKKTLQSNYIIENTVLEDTKKRVRKIHNILTKKNRFI